MRSAFDLTGERILIAGAAGCTGTALDAGGGPYMETERPSLTGDARGGMSVTEDVRLGAHSFLGIGVGSGRLVPMKAPCLAVLRCVWRLVHRVAALAPLCLVAGISTAETLTIGGMSFSDEPGGARLLAASGTGTRDDPIVLVEEIIGPGPAVLEIQNGRTGHLDVSPATGFLSLSVVKIIANRGPWRWAGFDLELMTGPDQPSVYTDGLSFDQPQTFQRIARADRFLQTVQEDEPFDRIRFDGGQVDPAEYLRLDFDIIDANGTAVFYLVQRPLILLAWDFPSGFEQQFAAVAEPHSSR